MITVLLKYWGDSTSLSPLCASLVNPQRFLVTVFKPIGPSYQWYERAKKDFETEHD